MGKEIVDNQHIKRNADGTFLKGFSGNPGGKLSNAQKYLRDFAIDCLPDIMPRMKEIYQCDGYPIEIREKVMRWIVERVVGRVPDEPPKDDEAINYQTMTGEQLFSALQWAMENKPKQDAQ